VTQSSF